MPVDGRAGPAADEEIRRLAAALRDRRPTRYERFVKPGLDRVLAATLLVLLSPLFALLALLVLATVGRPVLIGQQRAGRDGVPFTMLKFRTMLPDRRLQVTDRRGGVQGDNTTEDERRRSDRRLTHKTPDDPRHTVPGRLLRKASVDELPQLVNVLRGDMSLVGPRPELYALSQQFLPWQQCRHVVKPGITGLWQTTRRGQGLLLHECIDLDLRYIADVSFSRDIAILARTPAALLRNKGVV